MKKNLLSQSVLTGLVACSLVSVPVFAEVAEKDPEQKNLAIAPLISSSPSIGTGLGAAASYLYNTDEESETSQLTVMGLYSNTDSYYGGLRNMAYLNGGKLRSMTAIGGLNIKNDFDEGPMNGAKYASAQTIAFQRLSWDIGNKMFLGGHGIYIDSQFKDKNDVANAVPTLQDNTAVGLGVYFSYDDRDNFYYPYKGNFFEASTYSYLEAFGSDIEYNLLEMNYRHYTPLKDNNILALQAYGRYTSSNAPYSGLSYLGRRSVLRGFNAGEYAGERLTGGQAEYRHFLNQKWKAVAFVGMAYLNGDSAEEQSTDGMYYSGGVGLRYAIQPKDRVHFRLDVAVGNDGNQGFYIGIQEAF